jgi:hypothetical protein
MNGRRPPLLALLVAVLLTTSAHASAPAPPAEPYDPPSAIIGRIGRCFSSFLWDFGISGFVIQYSSCSIYIPIDTPDTGP